MSAIQGHKSEIWLQTADAAVAFVKEACTSVTSTLYKITDPAKRIWDPAVAVSVYVNDVLQTSGYHLHLPVGQIHFDSAPGGTVTVSGSYLAAAQVAYTQSWDLDIACEALEVTGQGDTARVFVGAGLYSWKGSLKKHYEGAATGNPQLADLLLSAKQHIVLKLYEDEPSDLVWVGFMDPVGWTVNAPAGLLDETLTFAGEGELFYVSDET